MPTKAKKKEETKEMGATKVKDPSTKELVAMIEGLAAAVNTLQYRFEKMADNPDSFKEEANIEDIEKANVSKEGIDSKIVDIVEESLGVDFGIEVVPNKDKPGFMFTIVVPQRLSPTTLDQRPVVDENGEYVMKNDTIVYEDYYPADKRSKNITSAQSYDAIRDHVDQVRANIVLYYQKLKQPLPEFKVR